MVTNTQEKKIPNGYKQTEVGVIPNDWEVKLVEEIADVKSGKRLPLGKSLSEQDTPHPYIRVADMFQGGVSVKELMFVPEDVYPAIRNYRIFKEDIFISVAGTLGIVGKIPRELDGANLTENADRLTNISCDRDFLLYLMMSSLIQTTIDSEGTLGAQPKLALTRIRKFQIPLPPTRDEQIAIASLISDAGALIEGLEKLIAKKRAIKQGAMQELLTGKRRLPGFSRATSSYKQTEVEAVPEDWNVTELKKITLSHRQGFYTKDRYIDNGVRLVRITDLLNPQINYGAMPMLRVSKSDYDLYRIKVGDFLFARSGAIGRYGIVYEDTEAIFGSYIIRFTFNSEKLKNEYFGFLYETSLIWKQLLSITQGSSNININASNIKSIKIPLPSIEEQTAIATILSDMDVEIDALEQKLSKYKTLKQGMMQVLLTGKVRLPH